jgi:molecular chaperone GrpE
MKDKQPEKKGGKRAAQSGPAKNSVKREAELALQLANKQDELLRALAENENYRKRAAREIDEARKYAGEELVRELVAVLDCLELALIAIRKEEKSGALLQGTELTLHQLREALGKFGVIKIESQGKQFDPRFHQAVLQEETSEQADGVVLEEFRSGYMMHERVIRASEVKVAKRIEKIPAAKDKKKRKGKG